MEISQTFIYQKRFGLFIFFLSIFRLIYNFVAIVLMSEYTMHDYWESNYVTLIVAILGLLTTLHKSFLFQISQVILTLAVAVGMMGSIIAVEDLLGEVIAFYGLMICIQYGWFIRHFYLKTFGILLSVLSLKVFLTITRIEVFARYLPREIILSRFIGHYIVFCAVLFFFWLLTKDQIQEYINKGKGIEDKFRKNSVFIDIGKIVWGFLHDLAYLNDSLSEIRLLKKNLEMIRQNPQPDEKKFNSCIACAARIEEMLLSINTKQEQIKKMIKAKHVLQKEPIDLNDMLSNLVNYLKIINKIRNINLELHLFHEKIYIKASPFEVLQAIENIVQNCIDAIVEHNGNSLKITSSIVNSKACIHIEDTGGGIKFIERSGNVGLEEFQVGRTTKIEHGTGWGMYSAIINIAQNGGQLSVNSLKGIGTTFEVLFNLDGR